MHPRRVEGVLPISLAFLDLPLSRVTAVPFCSVPNDVRCLSWPSTACRFVAAFPFPNDAASPLPSNVNMAVCRVKVNCTSRSLPEAAELGYSTEW